MSPVTNNEAQNAAPEASAYILNNYFVSDSVFDRSSDAAIALLQELARAHEVGAPRSQEPRLHQRTYESAPPLKKLPPSEWRSLGGYFDYEHWADRDRFMELDRAIAAAQRSQPFDFESEDSLF